MQTALASRGVPLDFSVRIAALGMSMDPDRFVVPAIEALGVARGAAIGVLNREGGKLYRLLLPEDRVLAIPVPKVGDFTLGADGVEDRIRLGLPSAAVLFAASLRRRAIAVEDRLGGGTIYTLALPRGEVLRWSGLGVHIAVRVPS